MSSSDASVASRARPFLRSRLDGHGQCLRTGRDAADGHLDLLCNGRADEQTVAAAQMADDGLVEGRRPPP